MKRFKGINLNLQLFASEGSFEDDDTILPDDFDTMFDDGTPADDEQGTESQEEPTGNEESAIDDQQRTEGELTEQQQQELHELLYNGEKKAVPYDELIKLGQMGMNYEKVQNRLQELQNDPRLALVDELAQQNGFDNVNDFIIEFREMQEQARIDELVQQNIPEEYAREMLENRKYREELQQQKQQEQQKQAEQQEYFDFFNAYKQSTGKEFDPQADQIPQEVIDIRMSENIPLQYAYMKFHNQQLQQQINVLNQNNSNNKRAPIKGGVTKHGSGDDPIDDFLAGFDSY